MKRKLCRLRCFALIGLLFCIPYGVFAQALKEVKGIIVDGTTQDPLIGVSVLVKGKSLSTSSGEDGQYVIQAAANDVLVFSYMGYKNQEVTVSSETLNISMEQDLAQLDEVVVIGYGTQRKSSVTAAISKLENDKLDQLPAGRAESALVGRMAGVNVANTRSNPGSPPIIRIRGAGSISANNDPLIVIDGFPGGSMSNVNMNDVESIEVLKDASSAAIYGSRGSGGVIIVTTKKGKTGKAKLNFNAYYGIADALGHKDWISGQEFYDYQARYINRDYTWNGGDASLPLWDDPRRPANYRVNPVIKEGNTNWEDVILDPAPIQNYNLSISGANDNVNYYVSGAITDEQGTLKNTSYKKYSVRSNVDVKINSFISGGFMLNPNYTERRLPALTMEAMSKTAPFVSPIRNADGSYPRPLDYWGTTVSAQVSPLASLAGTKNYSAVMNNIGQVYLAADIVDGLKFRTTLGTNITYVTDENYTAAYATSNGMTSASTNDKRGIDLINENVLSYDKIFNEDHSLNAILGASYQKSDSREAPMGVLAGSFGNDIIETLNNAIISPTATRTTKTQWGLISYFSRANYAYKDKYLLSASFRTDGSSRFGPNSRWGNFPSASVAWRVSQEDFMANVPTISNLKLRASYGVTGNFNIGDFQYLGTIEDTYYSPDGVLTKGQTQKNLGNLGLQWETTKSLDFGLELGLFKDRVNIVLDYYDKKTNNLLYNVGTPAITGFTSVITNIGDINNKGIELEISTRNMVGEFKWQTHLNFTKNNNKVVGLGGLDEVMNTHTRGMSWLLRLGDPMFSYYGYRLIGVLRDDADVANSAVLVGSKPGNGKYEDVNQDGKITAEDKVILGNFQPKFTMGMVNDFTWKAFDLSIAMQTSIGAKMYNLENLYYEGPTVSAMRRSLIKDQWWSTAEPGDGMHPATALSALPYVANSDYYIEDASFFAIRSLNLGYRIPENLGAKLKLNNCRIYLSATNLLMVTKKGFHGYNPEGYTQGEINGIKSLPGFNNGAEPINRVISFGINANF